jgi:hypothetical protein
MRGHDACESLLGLCQHIRCTLFSANYRLREPLWKADALDGARRAPRSATFWASKADGACKKRRATLGAPPLKDNNNAARRARRIALLSVAESYGEVRRLLPDCTSAGASSLKAWVYREVSCSLLKRIFMAKNRNTFAKHQRDMEKRAKAEAKRERRTDRRNARKAEPSGESEAETNSLLDLTNKDGHVST